MPGGGARHRYRRPQLPAVQRALQAWASTPNSAPPTEIAGGRMDAGGHGATVIGSQCAFVPRAPSKMLATATVRARLQTWLQRVSGWCSGNEAAPAGLSRIACLTTLRSGKGGLRSERTVAGVLYPSRQHAVSQHLLAAVRVRIRAGCDGTHSRRNREMFFDVGGELGLLQHLAGR